MGRKNGLVSPLCNDWNMYDYLSGLSKEHGLNMEVLIGITYAESHIGTNFAPSQTCSRMNNWAGIKAKKNDDGTRDSYKLPYSGCWLYPFKDMKEFWHGLANTISLGYVQGGCNTLECLSSWYVGNPGPVKHGWVTKVKFFINNK